MTGIIKTDQLKGAQSTTVTVPTGNTLAVTSNATVGGTLGVGTASPDGTLHVHSASAGSVTPQTAADDIVVENNGHGGISVLTPDANRSAIVFGHASDNHKMQIRHDGGTSLSQVISDDALTFNVGDGTERMRIDANGHMTMPTQPAVYAYATTFTLPINTHHEVVFTTERYDQNSDFNTTNGHFTAPVTGKYLLTTSLYLYNYLDTDASYYYLTLFTSNDTVDVLFFTQQFLDTDSQGYNMQCSSVFDMDAGDIGKVMLYQSGGAAITNIAGSHSNFTCTLLC